MSLRCLLVSMEPSTIFTGWSKTETALWTENHYRPTTPQPWTISAVSCKHNTIVCQDPKKHWAGCLPTETNVEELAWELEWTIPLCYVKERSRGWEPSLWYICMYKGSQMSRQCMRNCCFSSHITSACLFWFSFILDSCMSGICFVHGRHLVTSNVYYTQGKRTKGELESKTAHL
jgi:hypothetical protein